MRLRSRTADSPSRDQEPLPLGLKLVLAGVFAVLVLTVVVWLIFGPPEFYDRTSA